MEPSPATGSTPPSKGKAPKAAKAARPPKQPKESKAKDSKGARESKRPRRSGDGAADEASARAETPGPDAGLDEEGEKIRPDPAQGARVVVIHIGSANLRIGLSTSNTPLVVPHCIAFAQQKHGDELVDARGRDRNSA